MPTFREPGHSLQDEVRNISIQQRAANKYYKKTETRKIHLYIFISHQ